MCGHVGIAGKLEYRDEATTKRLLLFDYFRGTDSTGLAAIRKTDEAHIVKMASHPIDLFDTGKFSKVLCASSSKAFIGHNRAATKGKVNAVNAHPYEYGHIIGAHNGTLTQASWDALEKNLGYKTDVDSMAIFAHIETFGIEETVKELQGAWALVWYDLKKDTLNFLRNKERSFYFAWSKEFDKVIWASEWPMIQAATEMVGNNSYDYELYEDEDGACFFPTDIDVLHTFCLEELIGGAKELPDPRVMTLKGKEPPPPAAQSNYGYQYNRTDDPFTQTSGTTTTMGTPGTDASKYPGELTLFTDDSKPFGIFADKHDFDGMTLAGCMYCHDPVEFHDAGLVMFDSLDSILCSSCSSSSVNKIYLDPKSYDEYLKKGA